MANALVASARFEGDIVHIPANPRHPIWIFKDGTVKQERVISGLPPCPKYTMEYIAEEWAKIA